MRGGLVCISTIEPAERLGQLLLRGVEAQDLCERGRIEATGEGTNVRGAHRVHRVVPPVRGVTSRPERRRCGNRLINRCSPLRVGNGSRRRPDRRSVPSTVAFVGEAREGVATLPRLPALEGRHPGGLRGGAGTRQRRDGRRAARGSGGQAGPPVRRARGTRAGRGARSRRNRPRARSTSRTS